MTEQSLTRIRDLIQEDVNGRGLRADPERNLINACPDDFAGACRSIAETENASVAVITGFLIPHAQPPAGETDGPLGALFLARALTRLGIKVSLLTDPFCLPALGAGTFACGLGALVPVATIVPFFRAGRNPSAHPPTHLIALERVGPSHTPESLRSQPGANEGTVRQFLAEVPVEHYDRCHTMRGRDITDQMAPAAHQQIESAAHESPRVITIGIGDGGNEIGMGKIPWDVIRRNIPHAPIGGLIACRVPTDYLIVCGVSNWGAYGLAAGVSLLKRRPLDPDLFDPERERALLQLMVEKGPLVDGVTGLPTATVDGLDFDRYAAPLRALRQFAD